MHIEYAVTFEFPLRPPVTFRGTVQGSTASVCASRATKAAQKALTPIGWSSCVCVLLGRLPAKAEGVSGEATVSA